MANTAVCNDTSEAVEFFEPQGLYLKPIGKLNVSVQLPQLKTPGKSISNWEVMEKLKSMIKPDIFISLKIVKSTLEFLRFEGEVENKGLLKNILARVDGRLMKLSGFTESLKVRAAEAKVNFPSRHDWESFFRDAKNMNEMKPGERPDTLHIQDLPSRWFTNRKNSDKDKPSEYILKKVFDTYGNVRCVDIPMLDPYRKEMTASKKMGSIQTFTFGQDLTFEAYVQYNEYVGFDRAMNALRGMKLMFKDKGEDGKAWTANIKVDFDKTKHLSDKSIKRRRLEREKLEALEKEREDKVRKEREEEDRKKEVERKKRDEEEREKERKKQDKVQRRVDRRKEREEKRKEKAMEKKRFEEEKKLQHKIALEERRFLLAQRKLESLRLLTELFERVKVIKAQEDRVKQERELEEERLRQIALANKHRIDEQRRRAEMRRKRKLQLQQQEKELREKILKNWKSKEERKEEVQREELRRKLSGSKKLKSAVIMKR